MITGFLITIFFTFINAVFGLLPTGTLNSDITTAIDWFFQQAHGFDFILPVSTIIQVFIWAVIFEGAILLYKLGLLIINKLRGAG